MLPAPGGRCAVHASRAGGRVVYRGELDGRPRRLELGVRRGLRAGRSPALRRPGTYRVHAGRRRLAAVPHRVRRRRCTGRWWTTRCATSPRNGTAPTSCGSVLDREPANLTDAHAYVYADPAYDSNDNLIGSAHQDRRPCRRVRRLVRRRRRLREVRLHGQLRGRAAADRRAVDAGQLRRQAAAGGGVRPATGSRKLWNPAQKVMYVQVGIGNGNASNTIHGDYNFWFLPQARGPAERQPSGGNPGPSAYYVEYRPVFTAAAPGKKVSPELGRAVRRRLRARRAARRAAAPTGHGCWRWRARSTRTRKTTGVGQLVTAYPHDYYPGTEWKQRHALGRGRDRARRRAARRAAQRSCAPDLGRRGAVGARPTSPRATRPAATR